LHVLAEEERVFNMLYLTFPWASGTPIQHSVSLDLASVLPNGM